MTEAVLFDLDGTLIDPLPGITTSVRAAVAALGLAMPAPHVLRQFVGPPLREGLASMLGLDPEHIDIAVRAFRRAYAAGALFDYTIYPGVPAMLADLAGSGLPLIVATSKVQPFAVRVLEHTGLLDRFDSVHGASPDGRIRTKEQVVRAALTMSGVAPADVVLVGDRKHDVHGARACRVDCIGAAWGYGGDIELRTAGAAAVAAQPQDVPFFISPPGAQAARDR